MIIITRILRSSINALKSKKKRTFLSIIGIIIGVVTIIIILSICDAANSYLMGEYNKVGDNLMWVTMEENMNGRNETNVLNSDSLQIINKVEFVNDMEKRIPAPELSIPSLKTPEPGNEQLSIAWTAQNNVT